jgi:hypothetical protein
MNKTVLFIIAVLLSVSPLQMAVAQTEAPTPTEKVASKVDDLKERLATRVAELRQSAPKAINGTVSAVSVTTLTVDTQQKAMKIELTDDIKVFQIIRGKRTTLSTEDIDKNDVVTITGDYDATIDILKAKTIFIESTVKQVRLHGTISEINKSSNSFVITGVDGTKYTIDVETTTKTNTWSGTAIEKTGFSRLVIGQFVSVLGNPDAKDETTITALRILHFTMPGTTTPTPSLEATPTATKSGTPTRAVTPTRRVTPTSADEE